MYRSKLESISFLPLSSDTFNFSSKKVLSASSFLTLSSGKVSDASFYSRTLILSRLPLDSPAIVSFSANILM